MKASNPYEAKKNTVVPQRQRFFSEVEEEFSQILNPVGAIYITPDPFPKFAKGKKGH